MIVVLGPIMSSHTRNPEAHHRTCPLPLRRGWVVSGCINRYLGTSAVRDRGAPVTLRRRRAGGVAMSDRKPRNDFAGRPASPTLPRIDERLASPGRVLGADTTAELLRPAVACGSMRTMTPASTSPSSACGGQTAAVREGIPLGWRLSNGQAGWRILAPKMLPQSAD